MILMFRWCGWCHLKCITRESLNWKVPKDFSNSQSVLSVKKVSNLSRFLGQFLGNCRKKVEAIHSKDFLMHKNLGHLGPVWASIPHRLTTPYWARAFFGCENQRISLQVPWMNCRRLKKSGQDWNISLNIRGFCFWRVPSQRCCENGVSQPLFNPVGVGLPTPNNKITAKTSKFMKLDHPRV